jgi:hypothetical protein
MRQRESTTIYSIGGGFSLPNPSPFVTKVEMLCD